MPEENPTSVPGSGETPPPESLEASQEHPGRGRAAAPTAPPASQTPPPEERPLTKKEIEQMVRGMSPDVARQVGESLAPVLSKIVRRGQSLEDRLSSRMLKKVAPKAAHLDELVKSGDMTPERAQELKQKAVTDELIALGVSTEEPPNPALPSSQLYTNGNAPAMPTPQARLEAAMQRLNLSWEDLADKFKPGQNVSVDDVLDYLPEAAARKATAQKEAEIKEAALREAENNLNERRGRAAGAGAPPPGTAPPTTNNLNPYKVDSAELYQRSLRG